LLIVRAAVLRMNPVSQLAKVQSDPRVIHSKLVMYGSSGRLLLAVLLFVLVLFVLVLFVLVLFVLVLFVLVLFVLVLFVLVLFSDVFASSSPHATNRRQERATIANFFIFIPSFKNPALLYRKMRFISMT
jgi:hypothetical protein